MRCSMSKVLYGLDWNVSLENVYCSRDHPLLIAMFSGEGVQHLRPNADTGIILSRRITAIHRRQVGIEPEKTIVR